MARWTIERALDIRTILEGGEVGAWDVLAKRLGVTPAELVAWRTVADGLVDGFDPTTRLYEQFEGFFALEDVRAVDLAKRPFTGELVLGAERLHRAQVVKQPDVLMLAHMLPEVVPRDVAEANYRYYEPRTSHGSSLSPAIHASLAARLGLLEEAVEYNRMAAAIDLGNGMGNAAHGVHVASMGGQWQAAVMGFGGMRATREGLSLDPVLPHTWTALRFAVRWHGSRVAVSVEGKVLTLDLDGPVPLGLTDRELHPLGPGRYLARRGDGGWTAPEAVE
jgi:kojibiose phosphorylase